MASKNDPLLNQSSSFGTTGGTTLGESSTITTTTTTTDILNTDEDSISGTPLRSNLTGGLDSDVSAGAIAGSGFSGNRDADTDAGLGYATTTVSETYAVPGTVADDKSDATKAIDSAKGAAEQAKSALSTATDNVKNQAGQIAEQAKTKVGELTSQATDKVKEQIGGQKAKAAEGLTSITEVIRQTATNLEEKGQAPIAGAVTGFASQIENFAGYLQDKSVDELAEDVTAYAKQNPQLFVGGAFLLGIALARFLKSSNRTPINGNNGNGSYNTGTVTSRSNSFDNTPVIPAYTGTTTTTTFNDAATTDYARDTATLGTGSALTGAGTTGYSTADRGYESTNSTAI